MLSVVVVIVSVACVATEPSPSFAYLREILQNGSTSYNVSRDITEDASFDVPQLVRKYQYPIEVHHVTTYDGYILEMHRIPHGRYNNRRLGARPLVFIMHGLLCSSADWILMGPGRSLGYILAEEGFDVWMGNARGNRYSRHHVSLDPDSFLNTNFWQFSWDEIGNIDLPTMIDYIISHTGIRRMHYIGHSQGTTAFWVMGALRPEYNHKIISMHALAPVAYMAHNKDPLLKTFATHGNNIEKLMGLVGYGELLPNGLIMKWAGQELCMKVVINGICSSIMFLVGGWNPQQHNATMLPVILGHTPAGASVRQFVHYGQSITHGGFRRYSHGKLRNLQIYGNLNPPDYEVPRVSAPVFLHYSDSDPLAQVDDVFRLFKELGRPMGLFRISDPNFSHLDFMWGIDAKTLVYDRIVNLIKSINEV